jgi:hypothetical protein
MKIILALILMASSIFASDKSEAITPKDVALSVYTMQYDGHDYQLFYSHMFPNASSWMHDVDCKKCKYQQLEICMNEESFPQKIYFVMTIDESEIRVHRPVFSSEAEAIHFGKLLGTQFYVSEFIESQTKEYQP